MSEYEKPPPYADCLPGKGYQQMPPPPQGPPPGYQVGPAMYPMPQPSQAGPSVYIQQQPVPNYGTNITIQPVPVSEVIIVGGCPACRVGALEDDFSCLGILCAILFFPIGILCCLMSRQKRCPNCGAIFG